MRIYLKHFPVKNKPGKNTGIGDITGPVVETNMMGYADIKQTDTGLHMRSAEQYLVVTSTIFG